MPTNDPVKTPQQPDPHTTTPPRDPSAETGRDGEKSAVDVRAALVEAGLVQEGEEVPWLTKPWRGPFIMSLALLGDVSAACRGAKVSRATVYRARGSDEDFALVWRDAVETYADSLETVLWEWAKRGVPVVKTVTKTYTDKEGREVVETTETRSTQRWPTAAIFLLKGLRPEKYREHFRHEHGGAGPTGSPVRVKVERERTPARLEELLEIAAEVGWAPVEEEAS